MRKTSFRSLLADRDDDDVVGYTVIMTTMMMTASPAADTVPLQLQTTDIGACPPAAWSLARSHR
jgi:hypothetical protein